MLKKLTVIISFLFFSTQSVGANGIYELRDNERQIDFQFYYPLVQFKDPGINQIQRRRYVASGVSIVYQFYIHRHFGLNFSFDSWFVPIWLRGSKKMLYGFGSNVGAQYRAFPDSYFDPTFVIESGIYGVDAGAGEKLSSTFPISAQVGFNAYKQTSRFQDNQLALNIFAQSSYYFRMNDLAKPFVNSFGLAFRGSF